MTRFTSKTAFVTAAGQGIGRAIAERLAAEGATIIATDINADLLADLETQTAQLDVTDKQALTSAIQDADPDILVNCAGIVHAGTILEATDTDWSAAFTLNVTSQFHAIQAVLPGMMARGGGSIVNISSVVSSIIAAPGRFIYGASKAAIIGLTKSVATDYVTHGIRCNAICPGTIDSPSLHDRLRATGDYEGAHTAFVARQPMGRLGETFEVAALAAYLASDEAKFTTGQAHIIDGGWAMH